MSGGLGAGWEQAGSRRGRRVPKRILESPIPRTRGAPSARCPLGRCPLGPVPSRPGALSARCPLGPVPSGPVPSGPVPSRPVPSRPGALSARCPLGPLPSGPGAPWDRCPLGPVPPRPDTHSARCSLVLALRRTLERLPRLNREIPKTGKRPRAHQRLAIPGNRGRAKWAKVFCNNGVAAQRISYHGKRLPQPPARRPLARGR